MGAIFVSYRRSDSQGEAGRLFDDLVKHFGESMVFMDVVGIEAGRDFRKAIEESVAQCGVLLVVMGPAWLNATDENGARRLDDPADFVRIETASALQRDIPVIPVLVRGAEMPHAEQLPDIIRDLAYRNCIELTHARWRSDIQLLVDGLRRHAGGHSQSGSSAGSNPSVVPAQAGLAYARARETSGPAQGSAMHIDPATLQRVSRELALHIGPIADIVVKRAASKCTSTEDLYIKVSEEIDSQQEREKFLRRQTAAASAQLPAPKDTIALPTSESRTSGPVQPFITPAQLESGRPLTTKSSSSRSKYSLFIGGAVIVLILAFLLASRFAGRGGANSSQPSQGSSQSAHPEESAPAGSKPATPADGIGPSINESAPNEVVSGADSSATASKVDDVPRVRISREQANALLASKVLPVYPSTAQQARIQGEVVLRAVISKDGTVESLQGVSGHPFLLPAAIDAVKHWRYEPYLVNGKPRAVETEISVNFVLKNQ